MGPSRQASLASAPATLPSETPRGFQSGAPRPDVPIGRAVERRGAEKNVDVPTLYGSVHEAAVTVCGCAAGRGATRRFGLSAFFAARTLAQRRF